MRIEKLGKLYVAREGLRVRAGKSHLEALSKMTWEITKK